MNQYRVKKICSMNGIFCGIGDVIEAEEYEVRLYINADFIEEINIAEPIVAPTEEN